MTVLNILTAPNPQLLNKALPVEKVDKEIQHLKSIVIKDSKMKAELIELEKQFSSPKTYINARIAERQV